MMAELHAVSILTIGNELLDGRVLDSNASFLCAELERIGAVAKHVVSCCDSVSDIKNALSFCAARSRTIIVSGGLGPTSDDLTRDAVADYCGVSLDLNEELLQHIRSIFEKRGRKFESTNERQAYLPRGAEPVNNPMGTAPGFKIMLPQTQLDASCTLFALPGVPSELQRMYFESVEPYLKSAAGPLKAPRKAAFKLFGMPESVAGARIESLNLPKTVGVSYRASFPEIHIVLSTRDDTCDLDSLKKKAKEVLGLEYIVADSLELSFEAAFQALCMERGITIAAAESCSGGLASKLLTDTPGSSGFFIGSAVTYSNRAKCALLGVEPAAIDREGAVSYEVARQMAAGCRAKFGSDIAFSITGVAGPDGGSAEKPVGIFFIGFCADGVLEARRYFLPSSRSYIRRYSAFLAIDTARRHLLGLKAMPEYDPARK